MSQQIIECVPNFSEGRDRNLIQRIVDRIAAVDGVSLLDVDPGADTNRTVVTFVGKPEAVVEGAFQGIKAASELIDMTKHHGAHARQGACDVCPFVPVSGATMEDCVQLARQLGERVGKELNLPGYYYEEAATRPERRNLANVRKGEYESLPNKVKTPEGKPDFGPAEFVPRFGAVAVGVREFLVAYNVNLNTREKKLAHDIALDIREQGRSLKDENGKIVRDENGTAVKKPGRCKAVKGVGWYIPEYGCAQLSMNLVNYKVTGIHQAFDVICEEATRRGLRVTGSELVGLVPLNALLDVGRHYLRLQGRSDGVPEKELVHIAVRSLGLNELTPFDPEKKIIEYRMKQPGVVLLREMKITDFADELSTDSPAPGGGSIAALCGSLGASLAAMVANLTCGKANMADKFETMTETAVQAQAIKDRLLRLIDEDTDAFNEVMAAMKLPKKTDEQKAERSAAMEAANQLAARVPLETLRVILSSLPLIDKVTREGNPASITDAGVGALVARAGAKGAWYNVKINLGGITDETFKANTAADADQLLNDVNSACDQIDALLSEALR